MKHTIYYKSMRPFFIPDLHPRFLKRARLTHPSFLIPGHLIPDSPPLIRTILFLPLNLRFNPLRIQCPGSFSLPISLGVCAELFQYVSRYFGDPFRLSKKTTLIPSHSPSANLKPENLPFLYFPLIRFYPFVRF